MIGTNEHISAVVCQWRKVPSKWLINSPKNRELHLFYSYFQKQVTIRGPYEFTLLQYGIILYKLKKNSTKSNIKNTEIVMNEYFMNVFCFKYLLNFWKKNCESFEFYIKPTKFNDCKERNDNGGRWRWLLLKQFVYNNS